MAARGRFVSRTPRLGRLRAPGRLRRNRATAAAAPPAWQRRNPRRASTRHARQPEYVSERAALSEVSSGDARKNRGAALPFRRRLRSPGGRLLKVPSRASTAIRRSSAEPPSSNISSKTPRNATSAETEPLPPLAVPLLLEALPAVAQEPPTSGKLERLRKAYRVSKVQQNEERNPSKAPKTPRRRAQVFTKMTTPWPPKRCRDDATARSARSPIGWWLDTSTANPRSTWRSRNRGTLAEKISSTTSKPLPSSATFFANRPSCTA
mmetsp:Transcript_37807/g.100743  ORF Transcript_37807/g.100743 Transcript_37807/m.100743 type:complete len:265 (+) Transcript_37807:285-1079(+)